MDAAENTDRELWREPDEGAGDYYSDSIFVTDGGGIGINCGGHVIVLSLREWHRRALPSEAAHPMTAKVSRREVLEVVERLYKIFAASDINPQCAETLSGLLRDIRALPSDEGEVEKARGVSKHRVCVRHKLTYEAEYGCPVCIAARQHRQEG